MSFADAPAAISDDIAAIIRRAGLLGIPAWRVTTALEIHWGPQRRAPGISA